MMPSPYFAAVSRLFLFTLSVIATPFVVLSTQRAVADDLAPFIGSLAWDHTGKYCLVALPANRESRNGTDEVCFTLVKLAAPQFIVGGQYHVSPLSIDIPSLEGVARDRFVSVAAWPPRPFDEVICTVVRKKVPDAFFLDSRYQRFILIDPVDDPVQDAIVSYSFSGQAEQSWNLHEIAGGDHSRLRDNDGSLLYDVAWCSADHVNVYLKTASAWPHANGGVSPETAFLSLSIGERTISRDVTSEKAAIADLLNSRNDEAMIRVLDYLSISRRLYLLDELKEGVANHPSSSPLYPALTRLSEAYQAQVSIRRLGPTGTSIDE